CHHTPTSTRFLFKCPGAPRHLPSFPTRRSSDLSAMAASSAREVTSVGTTLARRLSARTSAAVRSAATRSNSAMTMSAPWHERARSEEHTSELQSRSDLVCRLLLEKKKKKNQRYD